MKAQLVDVSSLKPAEWNPRIIKKKPFRKLMDAIEDDPTFLWLRPVAAREKGEVYGGNMRLVAVIELAKEGRPCKVEEFENWKKIPAGLSKISLKEAKKRAIRDNGHFGEWDDGLTEIINELNEASVDLETLGLSDRELQNVIRELEPESLEQDEPPATPTNTVVETGWLYELGEHRLMCGDCTNKEHMQQLMGGAKGDLLLTDPPYGVNYGDKNKMLNQKGKGAGNRIEDGIENDTLGQEGTKNLVRDMLKNVHLKAGASFYIFSPAGDLETSFRIGIQESGYLLKQCMVWVKNQFVIGRSDYHYRHESILYGWGSGKHNYYGGRKQDSVWEFDKPQSSKLHPTMKPVDLIGKAIKNSSKEGDIIVDPFSGSGSTMMACEQLGRACYCMDLEPKYVEVAVKRWEKFTGKKAKKITATHE